MSATNGTGPAPDTAPTEVWRLSSDLTAEQELAIRTARLQGLRRLLADDESEAS